jgi:hypothetical protein
MFMQARPLKRTRLARSADTPIHFPGVRVCLPMHSAHEIATNKRTWVAQDGAPAQAATKPFSLRLAHSLSALVAGEPNWWSESLKSGDWDPFHGPLDPAAALTADSFRACAGVGARRTISSRPFDDYLDYVLGPAKLGEPSVSTWRAFQQIAGLVLSDRTIFSVGENGTADTRTYLVGRIADGSVVGIRAVTVET